LGRGIVCLTAGFLGSIGIALSAYTWPGQGTSDHLNLKNMEFGLGIQGEPGVAVFDRQPVDVAGFGWSNVMHTGQFLKTNCGSPNHSALEVIFGKPYTEPEVDVRDAPAQVAPGSSAELCHMGGQNYITECVDPPYLAWPAERIRAFKPYHLEPAESTKHETLSSTFKFESSMKALNPENEVFMFADPTCLAAEVTKMADVFRSCNCDFLHLVWFLPPLCLPRSSSGWHLSASGHGLELSWIPESCHGTSSEDIQDSLSDH
jgi:hypothetical protein